LFHHVARERRAAAKVAEPAQNAIVDVAVNVLDYRYLVDLKGKNTINNLIMADCTVLFIYFVLSSK